MGRLLAGWGVGRGPPVAAAWRAAQRAGFRTLLVHGTLLDPAELTALDAALAGRAAPPRVYPDGVRRYTIPPLDPTLSP